MLGLMMWYEHTGDKQAAVAVHRIADLVCNTCLDTGFRVINAGSEEMNMGIIHSMAQLYRKTGNPRYLRMVEEVLKDFEKAGDYYRTGLAGKEYFRTPRPRWESLHSLEGLVELYRITGDPSYRQDGGLGCGPAGRRRGAGPLPHARPPMAKRRRGHLAS
jgi:DUF1680 family protein